MTAMRTIMQRLKLTVNEEKTHLCQIPRERFDFLGYTFGRCYSRKDGLKQGAEDLISYLRRTEPVVRWPPACGTDSLRGGVGVQPHSPPATGASGRLRRDNLGPRVAL